ncbi:MAG: rRNA maturation RNase YbeY [Alphaproteobacteria bacterium]|nr:rRNA maturation RNase YbeY [Alphaproteobacteria bacterium]
MTSAHKPSNPAISYDITVDSKAWPTQATLRKHIRRVCGHLKAKGNITFVFTSDRKIRTLNHDWRGKDKATNVLSFPDGDLGEDGRVHLGDVILAFETVKREAKELGVPFAHHLTHLLLHGSLHLLGYDHIQEKDAKAMETLEIRLLAKMGIKNPYQMPLA